MSHEDHDPHSLQALKARYGDLGGEAIHVETADFKRLLVNEGNVLSALIKEQKISAD